MSLCFPFVFLVRQSLTQGVYFFTTGIGPRVLFQNYYTCTESNNSDKYFSGFLLLQDFQNKQNIIAAGFEIYFLFYLKRSRWTC